MLAVSADIVNWNFGPLFVCSVHGLPLLAKLYDGSEKNKNHLKNSVLAQHDEVLLDSLWIKEGCNKRRQHRNSLYLFIFCSDERIDLKTCLDLPWSVLDALFSDRGVPVLHTHTHTPSKRNKHTY